MSKMHVKTGDTVQIISGRGKGRQGKVLEVSPKEQKVIIEGFTSKKHVKPRKQGQAGGIIDVESPIYACKVMPVCPECEEPTRVGYTVVDGKKMRVCKRADCGATF
jgi:large subunit ribosomal protein L24